MANIEDLIRLYDATHPIVPRDHRFTRAFDDCRRIANLKLRTATFPRCVPFTRANLGETLSFEQPASCQYIALGSHYVRQEIHTSRNKLCSLYLAPVGVCFLNLTRSALSFEATYHV